MLRELRGREVGATRPSLLARHVRANRTRSIELASHKEIVSAQKSGINCLQIDPTESRYLLAGASNGSVGVYDTQQATSFDPILNISKHEALFTVDKHFLHGHRFSVSSVQWYPIDTGLFVTGSFDKNINLWDTNTLQVPVQFNMLGKVYAIAMSTIATTHMLVAAGTEHDKVRLCDLATGACTHTLAGHRDGVWALQWSASSEWEIYSGGCDGAIRFWDIRRAGCFRVLNINRSQLNQRPISSQSVPQVTASVSSGFKREGQPHGAMRGGKLSKTSSLLKAAMTKESEAQRQHPGLKLTNDRASAHYGVITALHTSDDGLYLFSAGTDSRVRLWDIKTGYNTLVNYESTRNRVRQGNQMAASSDSSLLFVASAHAIQTYDVWSGRMQSKLCGHYDDVNTCAFHSQDQELYSGSTDRQILVWTPPKRVPMDDLENAQKPGENAVKGNEDAWSD